MELNGNKLASRQRIVGAMVLGVGLLFVFRLFQMQVTTDDWKNRAERLTEEQEVLQPARGLCLDRNGELLVNNVPSYDLMVVPRSLSDVDTSALAELVGLDRQELDKRLAKARRYSRYKASPLLRQLNAEEYAAMSSELWRYWAVHPHQTRSSKRVWHRKPDCGRVQEVDREDMNCDSRTGWETTKASPGWKACLNRNCGTPGIRHHLVDVRNNVRNTLTELDSLPVTGEDVTLTLDAELQRYAELLMEGKRGAVVAIEPSTGEILAFVSAPSYDGNLLTGTSRGAAYDSLASHPWKPLYNRAVRGTYRPGSIFKMVQGLIAMQQGVISPRTHIVCNRDIIGCHGAHTQDDLRRAVVHSCNPYFYEVMRRMVNQHPEMDKFDNARLGLAGGRTESRTWAGNDLGGRTRHPTASFPTRRTTTTFTASTIGRTARFTHQHRGRGTPCHAIAHGQPRSHHGQQGPLLRPTWCGYRRQGQTYRPQVRHDVGVDAEHFDPILDAMQAVIEDRQARDDGPTPAASPRAARPVRSRTATRPVVSSWPLRHAKTHKSP